MITLPAVRTHDLYGTMVRQREEDGYINATELCKAAGKRLNDYTRLDSTQEFLSEMSSTAGIPAVELVQAREGRPDLGGGTWVHPDVAINLAQWLSPKFAVQVSKWVRELMTKGSVSIGSGDDLLDSILTIRNTVTVLAETRARQLALNVRIDEVQGIAQDAAHTAKAALAARESGLGYFTVLAYAKRAGIEMPLKDAQRHGRRLSGRCLAKGITVGRSPDERFGWVHSYPESELQGYFREFLEA